MEDTNALFIRNTTRILSEVIFRLFGKSRKTKTYNIRAGERVERCRCDDATTIRARDSEQPELADISHVCRTGFHSPVPDEKRVKRGTPISSFPPTNSLFPLVALSDNETRVTSGRRKETARRPHLARQYDSINDRATIRRIITLFFLASVASARC